MQYNTTKIIIFILSTIVGICFYSFLFLFSLGLKIIRHAANNLGTESWIVIEVIIASITVTITLTSVALIFFNRTISGHFFYISVIFGVLLIFWTTAGIIGPIKAALGLKRYTYIGLIIGNLIISFSNIIAFHTRMPSLL